MYATTSLSDREMELLRRHCGGAAPGCQPAGFNRKPFLVRILKDYDPVLAAKIKRMSAREVEALCGEASGGHPVAFEALLA
jgi:hypothetical protein